MKIFLSWFVIIFLIQTVYGQWEPTYGPFGGHINDLQKNSYYQFAATPNGLYRSADDGLNWTNISSNGLKNKAFLQFICNDSTLIGDAVDVSDGEPVRHLYKSTDNGIHWTEMNRPITQAYTQVGLGKNEIFLFDFWGDTLLYSDDDGKNWTGSSIHQLLDHISSMYSFKSDTYIGSLNKIYKSTDLTDSWTEFSIPGLGYAHEIYVDDSIIFVRNYSNGTLFRSLDKGQTWNNLTSNNWGSASTPFAKIGGIYFLITDNRIYKSLNKGSTWTVANSTGIQLAHSLLSTNNSLLIGCAWKGIYRSDNLGSSVQFSSTGLDASHVTTMIIRGDELLTGGIYHGVFNYNLLDPAWEQSYFDERFKEEVADMEIYDGSLYLLSYGVDGLYRYSDNSHLWFQATQPNFCLSPSDLYVGNDNFYIGGNRTFNNCYLDIKSPDGPTWMNYNVTIDQEDYNAFIIAFNNENCFVSDGKTVAISEDQGSNWKMTTGLFELGEGGYPRVIDLFGLDGYLYMINYNLDLQHSHLLRSSDEGNSWELIDFGLPHSEGNNTGIKNLIQVGNFLIATTYGYTDGLYFTHVDNIDWQPFNDNLPTRASNALIAHNDYMYVATEGRGVWRRQIEDLITTSTDQSLLTGIIVYPNPAKDEITIKIPNETIENSTVYISDLKGRFHTIDPILTDDGINMDVNSLPGGFYLLSVINNDSVFTSRFIIQR